MRPAQKKEQPLRRANLGMVRENKQNHCQQDKSSQDGATKGGEDACHAISPCFFDLIFLKTEKALNPGASGCTYQFTILGVAFFDKNCI
jgi:hypothetical protein